MAWIIEYDSNVLKELKKIDKSAAIRILEYMEELAKLENPRSQGKVLKGKLKHYWRYRLGDYRIICSIEDNVLQILVVGVGHRKEVYKK